MRIEVGSSLLGGFQVRDEGERDCLMRRDVGPSRVAAGRRLAAEGEGGWLLMLMPPNWRARGFVGRHRAAVRCVPFYLQVCRREETMRGRSWAPAGSGGFRFVGAQAVRSVRVASGEGGRSKRQVWKERNRGGVRTRGQAR